MIVGGLLAQLGLMVAAIVLAALVPTRYRAQATGPAVAGIGLAGAVTGVLALTGGQGRVEIPISLPIGTVGLAPTALGGFFMLVIGAVGAITAVYAVGYVHGPSASRTSWIALATFLTSMQFVAAAADVVSFLLFWELMAVASTVLVLTEHAQRASVRSAAVWYAAMTQVSFFLLLIGFAILTAGAGSTEFSAFTVTPWNATSSNFAFFSLSIAGPEKMAWVAQR